MSAAPPLWICPRCGRGFANVNQTHTCAELGTLDAHFAGRATVLPEKTRIAVHVRMSSAAFTPRLRWLDGHLVLARRVDSPRFRKIEVYSPRNVVHTFRLTTPDQVDDEFAGLLAEAYRVGEQRHRDRPRRVLCSLVAGPCTLYAEHAPDRPGGFA